MEAADIVIIGAGVIGLAIAAELSRNRDSSIFILEKNRKSGQEISSRNSEVIHSGLYYPSDMLKSRLCVEGRGLLYDYCRTHNIPHRRCGKLLIACQESEHEELQCLSEQADRNGVDCRWISKEEIPSLEPDIFASEGLLFPETGTIDAHSLVQSLQYEASSRGVSLVLDCAVQSAEWDGAYYHLQCGGERISARRVINAAGLGAARLAATLGIDAQEAGYIMHPCKGEYFKLRSRWKINHLVYPVPTDKSLGIHLSFDLSGQLRLGPSAEYINDSDYTVDPTHLKAFYNAARRYLPGLQPQDLSPDFAGIRPKLQGPGEPMRDFIIAEESGRGFPGWINLIGIESPGLTSCLAIARYVASMLPGS